MNAKNSVFVNCVEMIIYLLLYDLYDCAFKVCKNSVAYSVFRKIYILDSNISNIIKTMFQRSIISVDSLDLCADKIQRFEAFLDTTCIREKQITYYRCI